MVTSGGFQAGRSDKFGSVDGSRGAVVGEVVKVAAAVADADVDGGR